MAYFQIVTGYVKLPSLRPWRVINKYAEDHIETSAYKTVANVLRRMKQLTGGPELVKEIIADYQTRYVRRRKMMDALATV